jgi:NAD(P)-dependent dehydrogenase (short-subunit alcohol dehydrogenase family)
MEHAAILVTGASSGIGNFLARYLAQRGHPVYATARQEQDLEGLRQVEGVTPLRMDVRRREEVQAAVQQVQEAGRGLYGLVNNAGIGELGLLSTWTDEELRDIFEVNVFGPHRVTNACLPLLLQAGGRIVNIGSQGGMITSKYYGPYSMTKHALEAYTEALHAELSPYGVHASIVQPGGIISEIGSKAQATTLARFERAEPPFTEEARMVMQALREPSEPDSDAPESAINRKPSSPEIVAVAVYDALFSPQPKRRYLVGTRWEGDRVLNALVHKMLDENDSPQHGYTREELIAMLDKALAQHSAEKDGEQPN